MPRRLFPDTLEGRKEEAIYRAGVFMRKKPNTWDINTRAQLKAFLLWLHLIGIEVPKFLLETKQEEAVEFVEKTNQVAAQNSSVLMERFKEASKIE